jgi:GNAT superfamily N-acetyltransferase
MGAPATARFFFCGGTMTEIRRAVRADAPKLGRLRGASLVEMGYLEEYNRATFDQRASADIEGLFAADRLIAWVLCDDERVVGSACATFFERLPYPDGALHAEIAGVYVEPIYRGCGHASRLVEAVLADVAGYGVRTTYLRPSPLSKSLYERLGFTEDERSTMRLS